MKIDDRGGNKDVGVLTKGATTSTNKTGSSWESDSKLFTDEPIFPSRGSRHGDKVVFPWIFTEEVGLGIAKAAWILSATCFELVGTIWLEDDGANCKTFDMVYYLEPIFFN